MCEDKLILIIGGNEFIVPKKAGLAVFELLSGGDIYSRTTRWEKVGGVSKDVTYITLVSPYNAPQLRAIGPVEFHTGIENQRVRDEAKEESA